MPGPGGAPRPCLTCPLGARGWGRGGRRLLLGGGQGRAYLRQKRPELRQRGKPGGLARHARLHPPVQGLQHLIEAQVGRLGAEEQQVLEVGSAAGAEFMVASVAAGVQRTPDAVEVVCERLARQGQFLEDRGLVEWPDGTVSGCYGFRHALYQEVVYQRLGAGHRARLHRLIGGREEVGYGARTGEHAAALAMHFARGGDAQRAVPYLQQAAAKALTRCAYREAHEHLTSALALLATLPETPDQVLCELTVQLTLASVLVATQGDAALEVGHAYTRAHVLCQQVGDTEQLFPMLLGLSRAPRRRLLSKSTGRRESRKGRLVRPWGTRCAGAFGA